MFEVLILGYFLLEVLINLQEGCFNKMLWGCCRGSLTLIGLILSWTPSTPTIYVSDALNDSFFVQFSACVSRYIIEHKIWFHKLTEVL